MEVYWYPKAREELPGEGDRGGGDPGGVPANVNALCWEARWPLETRRALNPGGGAGGGGVWRSTRLGRGCSETYRLSDWVLP